MFRLQPPPGSTMPSSDLRRRSAGMCPGWRRTSLLALLVAAGLIGADLLAQARPTRPSAPVAALTPAAAAAALARAGDAVVTIVAYRDGTSAVVSGVGVRVIDGRILTSLRHLRGATRAEIFGPDGELLATATTLEQADPRLDLGVFSRVMSLGENLVLARRSAVLAAKVKLLGPRKATVRTVTERIVTNVGPDDQGRALLRLGATVASSAAGSPVVNLRSELVGIALGTVPGREDGDIAVDVSAVRELLLRPASLLAFPARDGSIAVARSALDPKAAGGTAAARTADAATRQRVGAIFPDRYGAPIGADTAGAWVVELFGCARLESRQKAYCYLRITNLQRGATFALNGGDLADSTRRKLRAAENLMLGETVQRVAGWRKKAEVPLRELESARVALEFTPPDRAGEPLRLMVDVSGEKPLWFGPFVLQRAP